MTTLTTAKAHLPTFLVIGTMKGGTTSLYKYLAQHPDVCMSSTKETNYFSTEFVRGVDWYRSLFGRDAIGFGEASPSYTMSGDVPARQVAERMHDLVPDAKLLYVLRDPVERMVSNYWHNVARKRELRDLNLALSAPDNENCYLRTSRYFRQLEDYLPFYDPSQLLLLTSEDLRRNTAVVMRRVFEFVGVDPNFHSNVFDYEYHRTAEKLRTDGPWKWLAMKVRRHLVLPFLPPESRKRRSTYLQTLDSGTKTALIERLSPDVQKLREFSGLNFGDWCL